MADRATQLGLPSSGASPRRNYAEVADRRTIDEIHKKEGVRPGQGGTCPHAAAGIAAAKRAAELAKQASDKKASENITSFESSSTPSGSTPRQAAAPTVVKPSMDAINAAMRMNGASPLFDYNAFYAEELDKKHKDKSYR